MELAKDYPVFCPNCGEHRNASVPYCVRCGFNWTTLADPATMLSRKLAGLADSELLMVLKMLIPVMRDIIARTSDNSGISISHVQRVARGERKSVEVDKALIFTFRDKLITQGVGGVLNIAPKQFTALPVVESDSQSKPIHVIC